MSNYCPVCGKETNNKYCSRACANKGYWLFSDPDILKTKKIKKSKDAKAQWERKTTEEKFNQINKQIQGFKITRSNKSQKELDQWRANIGKGVHKFYTSETAKHKEARIQSQLNVWKIKSPQEIEKYKELQHEIGVRTQANLCEEAKINRSKKLSQANYNYWKSIDEETYQYRCKRAKIGCKTRKYTKNVISKAESQFMEMLNTHNFLYYRNCIVDDRYPWHVDFYIKDFDVFIELNIHWTHGPHRFDPVIDAELLNTWYENAKNSNFYYNAIQTWTVRDPQKFEKAEQENLIYLVAYNENDFKTIINRLEEMRKCQI